MYKIRLHIFILFFVCTFSFSAWSQKKDYIELQATIVTDDGRLDGSALEIEINEKEKQSFSFKTDPKFIYRLKFQNNYKLTFSKPGAYSRIILISTEVPKSVLDINSDFPPIEFQINLLNEMVGIDKSFSLQPYASIFYDRNIDDFTSKQNFEGNMIAFQLDQAFAQEKELNKEKKTLDKLELQEMQEMQKEFDRLVREADGLFDRTQYQEALAKYQDANKLFPDRPYPLDRIREIQNLLDALRLANQQKQDINRQYRELIDRADARLREKLFSDALSLYQQSLQFKPNDNYANKKITEINQIIQQQATEKQFGEVFAQAEAQFNGKEYTQARELYRQAANLIPADPRPEARISEINQLLQSIAEQTAREDGYRQAMLDGEQEFAKQKYPESIAAFRKALEFKNNDSLALQNINKAEAAQKGMADQQAFDIAITEADKAFRKKDYPTASNLYQQALMVKPQEKYPQDQLALISEIISSEEAELLRREQYARFVRTGDSLMQVPAWEQAKTAFTKALEISPKESHPNRMILQINQELEKIATTLARQKETEQRYLQIISRADVLFGNKEYSQAKTAYSEALTIKPNESYPATQIAEADRMLRSIAEQTAIETGYRQALLEGDQQLARQKFTEAIAAFRRALQYKTNDALALQNISKAETAQKQFSDQQTYDTAITEADKAFRRKDFNVSETLYKQALAVKPQEKYPQDQLNLIAEMRSNEEAEQMRRMQYAQLIKKGDSLMQKSTLEPAKTAFTSALQLAPQEAYPSRMILLINQEIEKIATTQAAQRETDRNYQLAITRADKFFDNNEYSQAKAAYNEALNLKAGEKYPTDRIALIDQRIQQETDLRYRQHITEGDRLFNQQEYSSSIAKYIEALQVKSNDSYAAGQIAEANRLIEKLATEKARQQKLDADYLRLIEQAADYARRSDLEKEKAKLKEAQTLKPNETYPPTRIAEIDQQLENMRIARENERLYAENMKAGQKAFNSDLMIEAQALFGKALEFKTNDPTALQRLEEIKNILDQRAEIERMAQMEEEQRLAAEKANRNRYNQSIAAADSDFAEKKYQEARNHYASAISALPSESYPKEKIKEIDNLLDELRLQAEMARQTAIRDSSESARQQEYDRTYRQAEQLGNAKKYDEAIARYNEAIQIWPAKRSEVAVKIDELKDLKRIAEKQLADYKTNIAYADQLFQKSEYEEARNLYAEAGTILPSEEYPKNQIRIIQNIINKHNSEYSAFIAQGDEFVIQEKWQSAKNSYLEALEKKPNDEYASKKLKFINEKIALLLAADAEKSLTQKAFNDMLKQGEEALANGKLEEAKQLFGIAQTLVPEEKYPQEKITEIDQLIVAANEDRMKQELNKNSDESYRQIIAKADQLFRNKLYDDAVQQYLTALDVKPGESYPQKQIDRIRELTAPAEPAPAIVTIPEKTAQAEPVNIPVKTKEPEPSFSDSKQLYADNIQKADELFSKNDYASARFYYFKAADIKPTEQYPKQRIEEIVKLIDSSLSLNTVNAYEQAIQQADVAFEGKQYPIARFYYLKALSFKPWEQYPKNRIDEIKEIIFKMLSERQQQQYNEAIAQADKSYFAKDYSVARFYYQEASRISPMEDYPKLKLEDLKKLIAQNERDHEQQAYMNHLKQADQAFSNGDYSVSRFYYNQALKIRKNESYPKEQLEKIKEQIILKNK